MLQNETADAMFYLGDGLYDLNAALELRREPVPYPIYRVAGNCDVNYSEPSEGLAPFGGVDRCRPGRHPSLLNRRNFPFPTRRFRP